jgi:hypothetical protein
MSDLIDTLAELVRKALPWRQLLEMDKPAPYSDAVLASMLDQEIQEAYDEAA